MTGLPVLTGGMLERGVGDGGGVTAGEEVREEMAGCCLVWKSGGMTRIYAGLG
jgi:hypothetical protein